MAERWRFYLAGGLHAAGGLWIVGWAVGRVAPLEPLLGPTGWLPVPVGLMLVTLSVPLLLRGRGGPSACVRPDGGTPDQGLPR
jgi:hypothetical protein